MDEVLDVSVNDKRTDNRSNKVRRVVCRSLAFFALVLAGSIVLFGPGQFRNELVIVNSRSTPIEIVKVFQFASNLTLNSAGERQLMAGRILAPNTEVRLAVRTDKFGAQGMIVLPAPADSIPFFVGAAYWGQSGVIEFTSTGMSYSWKRSLLGQWADIAATSLPFLYRVLYCT